MNGTSAYYDRRRGVRGRFRTESDAEAEAFVRDRVERAWGITCGAWEADTAPLDFYGVREGKIVCHLEIKSRDVPSSEATFATLNFRKWHALFMTWVTTGIPSIFLMRYQDAILYIDVRDVDPRTFVLGGCVREVKSKNDREPIVKVPLASMNRLA